MAIHSADQITKGIRFETGGEFDVSNARQILQVQTGTANYTVKEAESGTLFTTFTDDGSIEYTLPANPKSGLFYYFFQSVNQDITIKSAANDGIITNGDVNADAVIASTPGEKIGAMFFVFADGNIWNAACISNGTTLTVTT